MNLERRIDLSSQYLRDLRVRLATAPMLGWRASVSTDRIGDAEQTFVRYASSPSDAIDLALRAAAEWVQKQKDIR